MSLASKSASDGITPEKVMHVLSLKDTASADETAMAIIEMDGISSKDRIADAKIEVEHILRKLRDEGKIMIVSDAGEEMRFARMLDES